MKKLDRYEQGLHRAYEKGKLVSARPTRAQLRSLGDAARAVPYQTLIASVLHKYVSGRLREARSRLTTRSTRARAKATRAG